MRSGFATLLGRPNAGKSTLLNRLVGTRVAITSPKPQTTRRRVVGIVNRPGGQVAFVDTPGIHHGTRALGRAMATAAERAAADADVVLFVLDAERLTLRPSPRLEEDDHRALTVLKRVGKPTLAVLTKVDAVRKAALLPCIALCARMHPFAEILPVSGRNGEGVEQLIALTLPHVPEGEPMFDAAQFTQESERDLVSEYIREQVIRQCYAEVPYAVAVVIQEFDESKRDRDFTRIAADIIVDSNSKKAILVGKGGGMVKSIGSAARAEIERLLDTKVFLALNVKVVPNWTTRASSVSLFEPQR